MGLSEKEYAIAFSAFFLFGPKRLPLLKKYFGSYQKIWEAPEKDLFEIKLPAVTVQKFIRFRKDFSLNDYLKKINLNKITILPIEEENYPSLLKEIPDPPLILYVKSSLDFKSLFKKPTIAVVGSRRISIYGKIITQKIVEELVFSSVTIVSGLARGVDVYAHKTALENKGLTFAVLGSAIDRIYPAEHLRISGEIVNNGALISEFPLGMEAFPGNFPIRNRIISGLSLGVLVTEAAEKSGTMITASYAADQGREVFAVPGPITSQNSQGTSVLLKKGAKLVTKASDILEEFPKITFIKNQTETKELSNEEAVIIKILKENPFSLDQLVRLTGYEAAKLLSLITLMELKGLLKKTGELVYIK